MMKNTMKKILLKLAVLALIALGVGCSNPSGGGGGSPPPPNSITGFTVAGAAGTINTEARTVTVTLPQGTALTALSPVISINGADISPASEEAQDFFTSSGYSPVIYTVTGADASEAIWTVTVKWQALAPGADIATYLATAESGIPGGPVILPVSMDLSGNGWADLLDAISGSASGVALDLSACTMSGAEFDPYLSAATGEGKIVSLILPDAATSIKAGNFSAPTFKHFSALKSVTGGAVTGIGSYAFYDCSTLEAVSLPTATSIGNRAFAYCNALETVSFPAATSIGDNAFSVCTGLTSVDLPAATSIGDDAFAYCTSLTSVDLPATAHIGAEAFSNCTSLMSISLPASLTSIEANPFTECIGLSISVAAANPKYMVEGVNKLLTTDGATLIGWPAASGDVTLSGITTVGNYAFYGCTGLTSVDLPAATTIGWYAFVGCTGLTSVDLPAATIIGLSAFRSCTGLTSADLPAATTIGDYAFMTTRTEKALTITLGDTPPELGTRMFYDVTGGTKSVTVIVPATATDWSGKTGSFTNAENTTGGPHWGEGFRGKGWTSGGAYVDSEYAIVNENINLTITAE